MKGYVYFVITLSQLSLSGCGPAMLLNRDCETEASNPLPIYCFPQCNTIFSGGGVGLLLRRGVCAMLSMFRRRPSLQDPTQRRRVQLPFATSEKIMYLSPKPCTPLTIHPAAVRRVQTLSTRRHSLQLEVCC